MKQHIVYMVRCADGTLYTGYTNDIEKRVAAHNSPDKGAKYTRGRQPVELVYMERYETKSAAMQREYVIKQLTKGEKEALVEQ